MGVFDKIKNALFEEEYVEVEEKPKKSKKPKTKVKETEIIEKPIAKKIVLPEKKEVKIEELDDEELLDEDFEIEPKKSKEKPIEDNKVEKRNDFMMMDDSDFMVDNEEDFRRNDEPKIINSDSNLDVDYRRDYEDRNKSSYYHGRPIEKEKQPYGLDSVSKVRVHDYGSGLYERKDDKTYFKPSPIISPIYGILDKNYKKEDVVQKKEVRLKSTYSREKVSVDDVRNKAYGTISDEIVKDIEEPIVDDSFAVEDDNILVDLTIEDDKPSVKEVTMGDALEYFQDLGLEYNVDYVDASKGRNSNRRVKEHYEEVEEYKDEDDSIIKEKVKVEIKKEQEITKVLKEDKEKEVVKSDSKNEEIELDSDDNLFDLIDSMYQEND